MVELVKIEDWAVTQRMGPNFGGEHHLFVGRDGVLFAVVVKGCSGRSLWDFVKHTSGSYAGATSAQFTGLARRMEAMEEEFRSGKSPDPPWVKLT